MATDPIGNILVTDQRNDRVCLFSSQGDFLQHLVDDTPRPYNVCCRHGMMAVSHYSLNGTSKVTLYSLDKLAAEQQADVVDGKPEEVERETEESTVLNSSSSESQPDQSQSKLQTKLRTNSFLETEV